MKKKMSKSEYRRQGKLENSVQKQSIRLSQRTISSQSQQQEEYENLTYEQWNTEIDLEKLVLPSTTEAEGKLSWLSILTLASGPPVAVYSSKKKVAITIKKLMGFKLLAIIFLNR